ncbi:UPF0496 protein At4g34320-like [Rosa rugosa]|nr:UPF0496 protein At4g34320-like [Rosa rugosa]
MRMSSGLDRFKQGISYLRNSDQKTVETIMSCKTQILAAEGDVATEIENFLDKFLIKQYLENSNQTLALCEVELPDFIKKADKVASCIKDVVRERRMLNKLNTAKIKYHESAKEIVKKVVSLQDQHLTLLDKLKAEFRKLNKRLKRIRTVRKVVHVIFIGILSAVFACSVMAAAMTIPGVAATMSSHPGVAAFIAACAVAQTSSSAIKVGQHWLLTMIRESESTLEARRNLIACMESGTKDAIKVLDDIMRHVDKVIASGNDPRLSSLSSANERPVELDAKLKKFQKEIEELDKTRKACIPVINKARKQVDVEYEELKMLLARRKSKLLSKK